MQYIVSSPAAMRETGGGSARLSLGRNVGTTLLHPTRIHRIGPACADEGDPSAYLDPGSEGRYEREGRLKREAKLREETNGFKAAAEDHPAA